MKPLKSTQQPEKMEMIDMGAMNPCIILSSCLSEMLNKMGETMGSCRIPQDSLESQMEIFPLAQKG